MSLSKPCNGRGHDSSGRALVQRRLQDDSSCVHNKASEFFVELLHMGQVLEKRSQSRKVEFYMKPIVDHLIALGTAELKYPILEDTVKSPRNRKARTSQCSETNLTLETIRRKISQHGYLCPMEVLKDIHGVLRPYLSDEARKLYKAVSAGEKYLELLGKCPEVKKALNLCCMELKVFNRRAVSCMGGCDVLIDIGVQCYEITDGFNLKYYVCRKCYGRNSETIKVKMRRSAQSDELHVFEISKRDFVQVQYGQENGKEIPESMVKCVYCRTSQHRSCVFYDEFNWETGYTAYCPNFPGNFYPVYVCESCLKEMGETEGIQPIYKPSKLRHTRLSRFMEADIQSFNYQAAKAVGLGLPSSVIVRVMSSRRVLYSAEPKMKVEFEKAGRKSEFVYDEYHIMAFQHDKETNQEVAVFTFIAQEYFEELRINLSYIDSVRLFQPSKIRSGFHKQVLLSYLKFVKVKKVTIFGFLNIWACPPKPGDEYVFYGRPEEQRPMDEQRLRQWYHDFLMRGIKQNVVDHFYHIEQDTYNSYLDIPYMKGDNWPESLEAKLQSCESDMEKYYADLAKQHAEEDTNCCPKRSTRHKKAMGSKKVKKSEIKMPDSVQKRIDDQIKVEGKNFFVVHLKSRLENEESTTVKSEKASTALEGDNEDEPDTWCPFMNDRLPLMSACRDNNRDFSNRARAIDATLFMMSRIANQSLNTKCSCCELNISKGFYCYQCDGSIFCGNCKTLHPHQETLRSCIVPFQKPKEISTGFRTILKQFKVEADFLLKFVYHKCAPMHKSKIRIDRKSRESARILNHHLDLINKEDTKHGEPYECEICHTGWQSLMRHKEFCKGRLCHVPSCSHKIVFDNNGTFVDNGLPLMLPPPPHPRNGMFGLNLMDQ